MPYEPTASDYEPLAPRRRARAHAADETAGTRALQDYARVRRGAAAREDERRREDGRLVREDKWLSREDERLTRGDDRMTREGERLARGNVRAASGREDESTRRVDEDRGAARVDEDGGAARVDSGARAKAGKSGSDGRRGGLLSSAWEWPPLRRGHAVSFAGLLLFTAVVYFRPQEFVSALASMSPSLAFWVAVATLVVFLPAQLGLEGTLTARPREVNLVFVLLLLGLVGVPLAMGPGEAWAAWVDYAKVVTMFVVMINVVRTEGRLRSMLWLALAVSVILSVGALYDYHTGRLAPNGDRIEGVVGGLFENPNDLALHLVTMVPLAAGLLLAARGLSRKVVYGAAALLMSLAVVITYSRGGLMALGCASFVMAWKLKRRNRGLVVAGFLAAAVLFAVLVPSEFAARFSSVLGASAADGGSAESRQALLIRSLNVSLHHPLLGVGMNNFHILSIGEKVSHNAYTQVSSEMGLAALAAYVLLLLAALKRMRGVERAASERRRRERVYYLAIGMQASIVGYMVASFFASVAYLWYVYYLVGYALCLERLYATAGAEVFGAKGARASVADKADAASGDALGEGAAGEDEWRADGDGRAPSVAFGERLAAEDGR
jgi:putative inorganic carbon (hco3(-)) transporter